LTNGWCKVKKAAAYADVSDRTLEDWLKQGLKFIRLPTGTRLIKYEWIDEYLEGYVDSGNHVDKVVDEIISEMKISS
jgi:excisionase family DNA binding protein